MNPAEFDGPGRGAGIEAGFAEALENTRETGAGNPERQQVSDTRQRATRQSAEESDLTAAGIGERTGDQAAAERDEAEDADDQSNGLVGSAEIVPHMRSERRQNGADAEEPEEGGGNETPKACAESGRKKTHEA
jgi:hypothetical protein